MPATCSTRAHARWRDEYDAIEIPLAGGNVSTVVRVGDIVRRNAGSWTPAGHALLRHLAAAGFTAAPSALGVDNAGREIISFVEGQPGRYPMPDYVWFDATLADTGRLLRRHHDLTATFVAPTDAVWQGYAEDPGPRRGHLPRRLGSVQRHLPQPSSRSHGRLGLPAPRQPPGRPGLHGLHVGSAAAGRGPRLAGCGDAADQGRRLRLLCDAYGLEDRGGVVAAVLDRITRLPAWIETMAADGHPASQAMVDAGQPASYGAVRDYLNARRTSLEAAVFCRAAEI